LPDTETFGSRLEGHVEIARVDSRPGDESHCRPEALSDALAAEHHVPQVVGIVELEARGIVDLARCGIVGPKPVEAQAQAPGTPEVGRREACVDADEVLVARAGGIPA